MQLSHAGHVLIQHAKDLIATEELAESALKSTGERGDVRFGMPQDFASSKLSSTLSRFRRSHPNVKVSAVIERNGVVANLLKCGLLDVALLISRRAPPGAVASIKRESCWFASADFCRLRGRPLPLVLLNQPCVYREFALRSLDRQAVPWEIAFSSANVSAMWAAVAAGVGVTVRMDLGAPESALKVGNALDLPDLPPTVLSVVQSDRSRSTPAAALAELVGKSLERMERRSPPAR
jgi:DNA-binding transcriptional LysR family regulator